MPAATTPSAPRPRCEFKLSTLLSLLSTLFLVVYYLLGSHFLPLSIVLPIAGQVLARGLVALNDAFVNLIGLLATHVRVPLDLITCSIIEMDTRTARSFSWPYIFVGGFITLFFVNTPEVLLGTLATGRNDIRQTTQSLSTVELASFGGGFNRSSYYTSGLVLASSATPDTAYREVAYRLPDGAWAVPRKPTAFYTRFAHAGRKPHHSSPNPARPGHPQNDLESRVYVPRNPVVVLRQVAAPAPDDRCSVWCASDFNYSISLKVYASGVFGFTVAGPDLSAHADFFTLTAGHATVHYWSVDNNRVMTGSVPVEGRRVPLPRPDRLWADMGHCLLNAVSFNRARGSGMRVGEKLALSSLVRVAGLGHPSGFEHPPLFVEARVTQVRSSNVSRYVVVTMIGSVLAMVLCEAFFSLRMRIVSRELGQWIQMAEELAAKKVLSSWPRYTRFPKGARELLVRLERVAVDGEEALMLRIAE